MTQTKFQGNQLSGSGKEDIFYVIFLTYMGMAASLVM